MTARTEPFDEDQFIARWSTVLQVSRENGVLVVFSPSSSQPVSQSQQPYPLQTAVEEFNKRAGVRTLPDRKGRNRGISEDMGVGGGGGGAPAKTQVSQSQM